MSLRVFGSVRCDHPTCLGAGPEVQAADFDEIDRKAHAEARAEGWYVDARKTLCPRHWPTFASDGPSTLHRPGTGFINVERYRSTDDE